MKLKKILLLFSLLALYVPALLAQTGIIRGKIQDSETGEALIGVNVIIKDSYNGTITDFEGNFTLPDVEPGEVDLQISYVSYATKIVEDVEVEAGEVTVLNVFLEPASIDIEEVVVTAKQIKNSENAVLAMQKKAEGIQDGISSEEMKRFATSDAAESMTKITGVSVMNGKDIFIRGLGDRYASAQLDGQQLPGTNPYKNSPQLDLIPANLLENIITSKTFTPDQPGNFTGGNVDIQTKSFPNDFTFNFSMGLAYNDQASLNNKFLTHEGGKTDWLGYDDGTRAIPDILQDTTVTQFLTRTVDIRASRDDSLAQVLDRASNSVLNQMAPGTKRSGLNNKFSLSLGNQVNLFGKPLGFLAGINYKKDYSYYDDGISALYFLADSGAAELTRDYYFSDTRGSENAQVSGIANIAYKYGKNHSIEFKTVYNHDGQNDNRYLAGSWPGGISNSANIFETRSLHFTERELRIFKLSGTNVFENANNTRIDWSISDIRSRQEEPDLRFFANDYTPQEEDTLYYISSSEYDLPFHYFRDLIDDQIQGKIDVTIPFLQSSSSSNKIKFGAFYSDKERDFNENRYQMVKKFNVGDNYEGNPEEYFSEENTGIIGYDSTRNRWLFGNYLTDETIAQNQYTGGERVTAAYFMISLNFTPSLKVVGGARYETTEMFARSARYFIVDSASRSQYYGEIVKGDLLPSLNVIYSLTDDMKLRGSYTQTLARPNMREMAPFASFDFIGGVIINGNPELERTLISNYDLRWEWYPNPGEIIAVSGYYKDFNNPIIKQYILTAGNPQIKYVNVPEALVYGVEFELRKGLGFISPAIDDLKFAANFSLINSEVDIDPEEYEIISGRNPEFDEPTRPFQGQSPYLLNLNLSYTNEEIGFDGGFSYNLFGPRLTEVSERGTPDVYESPAGMLNFVAKKKIRERFTVSFNIKNILDAANRRVLNYKDQEYIIQEFYRGRTYSLSLSYNIN
jgi:TonB-dependent receptor